MSEAYRYNRNDIPGGHDIIIDVRTDLAVPNNLLSDDIESAFPAKTFGIKINGLVVSITFEEILTDNEAVVLDQVIDAHRLYFSELIEDVDVSTLYFKIRVSDLTDSILERSTDKCPLTAPRSNDGYIMLKYLDNNLPAYLVRGNFAPFTLSEVQVELQNPEWDSGAIPLVATHSIKLDGINKYLDLGDEHELVMTEAWTWSIWIKPQNLAAKRCILTRSGGSPGVYGFILQHKIDGEIYLQVRNPSINTTGTFSGTLNAGVWNHLIISNSGSGLLSGLKVHIDGTWDSTTLPGTNVTTGYGVTNSTRLGARNGWGFFSGNMSSTTVWNKQLSDAEVTELYNSGSPADPRQVTFSANLLSSWSLDNKDIYPILSDNEGLIDGTAVNVELNDYQEDIP